MAHTVERERVSRTVGATDFFIPLRRQTFPARVAVTGADGFVGRALMTRLLAVPTRPFGLVRDGSAMRGARIVKGPLGAPSAQTALALSECVIHLAGAL